MDEKIVVDYFVVAGLPPNPEPLGEFSKEVNLKSSHAQAPITDITVIIRSLGEEVPEGYKIIETTPTGLAADLNHGSIRSPSVFLCYRRGRDKPPLVDIGVLYEGKERVMADSQVVHTTPNGRPANVNNSTARTYLTYRRAPETAPCNQLVVTDICVILTNKGEVPPHAFCQINKTLNKGMLGSDVYICYKKSMGKADYIAYKPGIFARCPLEDHSNFPFPESVPLFCLPMGATIECWPAKAQHPHPVFSTFVLTVSAAAEKVYGAAVTFYEDFPEDKLTEDQANKLKFDPKINANVLTKTIHTNKSICLLSHWPFFETFEKFLFYLYRMSIGGPHSVPIERYISHFMNEVPFPSPQRPRILIQLDHDTITLAQPEDSPLTLSGASFRTLLQNLGPDNCMKVLVFALTEQKILIHSLRQDVLTSVAEAVSMMIFPFHWQCPYIPLCPLGLSDVLSAPLPFIVGVDSRYFDLFEPPHDVNCVDLDTNTISVCEERKGLCEKLLPKRPAKLLQSTLLNLFERICRDSSNTTSSPKNDFVQDMAPTDRDFKKCRQRRALELEIQETFLRFMAQILKGFRSFLLPITKAPTAGTTDPNSLFDLQGFLKSRDKAYHKFFNMVMKTQTFIRFIEERSFVTDKDASLAFFDECTEKVDINFEKNEPRLLEYDDSQQSDRTVFVTPPEPIGLPPGLKYSYSGFPELRTELFLKAEVKIPGQSKSPPCPNSPMAKRTKQEVRSAQKSAKKQAQTPLSWAKCLISYCYSLWFIHLPAYVKATHSKARALRTAYDVLKKMQQSRLQPPDEVCYRVLMHLCGIYSQPVLAVKVLFEMKKNGVQPNAITYGYYNKAVLESKWPSSNTRALWSKLRNVILGCGTLRRGRQSRISVISTADQLSQLNVDVNLDTQSEMTEFVNDLVSTTPVVDDQVSTEGSSDVGYSSMVLDETGKSSSSIHSQSSSTLNDLPVTKPSKPALRERSKSDSGNKCPEKAANKLRFEAVDFKESDEFRTRVGSIVCRSISSFDSNASLCTIQGNTSKVESAAGLLITSQNSLYESEHIFDNTVAVNSAVGRPPAHRKRHKSAGDYVRRANEVYRYRHRSGPNNDVNLCLPLGNPENHIDTTGNVLRLRSDSFGNDLKIISGLRARNAARGRKNIEHTPNKGDEMLMDIVDGPITVDEKVENNESSLEESKSCSSSRQHTPSRTPVTENDPLGLFSDYREAITPSAPQQSTPSYDLMSFPQISKQNDSFLDLDTINNQDNDSIEDSDVCLRSKPGRVNSSMDYITKLKRRSADESMGILTVADKCTLRRGVESLPPSRRVSQVTSPTLSPPTSGNIRPMSSPRTISQPSMMLLEGFKFAANAVATKFSEFRQSISAPGSKPSSYPKPFEMEKLLLYDDDEDDNASCDSQRASVDYLSRSEEASFAHLMQEDSQENNSDSKSFSVDSLLPSRIYTKGAGPWSIPQFSHLAQYMTKDKNSASPKSQKGGSRMFPVLMEVSLTTCSRCYNCNCMLYDEEIMAGWTADDSNLNTRCQFCSSKLVPFMTVSVKDLHCNGLGNIITQSKSDESIMSVQSSPSLRQRVISPSPESKHSTAESLNSDSFMMFEDLPDSCENLSAISTPLDSPHKPSIIHSSGVQIPTHGVKIERRRCTSECHTSTTESTRMSNPKPIPGIYQSFRNAYAEESPVSSLQQETRQEEFLLKKARVLEPITVPYLSPLVLRKEVENVLEQEGDRSLIRADFVDEHPIIFWNLIWYFKRLDIPSHLPALILVAPSIHKDQPIAKKVSSADSKYVMIRCMWDNLKLHEEAGQPMYLLWNQSGYQSSLVHALITERQAFSKPVMQQIVHYIQCNDLLSPLRLMLNQSQVMLKSNKKRPRHRSFYRDILYLALIALGRTNIDLKAFDREYKKAFIKLSQKEMGTMQSDDRPPTLATMWCRRMFEELELV